MRYVRVKFFFQTYTYLDKSYEGRAGKQEILRGAMRARMRAVPIKDSIHIEYVGTSGGEDGSTYKEGKENACVKH